VIQQIGTPMELYDHPANRFIAHFVGTINLLKGKVEAMGPDMAFISGTLGRITLPRIAGAAAGEAEIAIRPHALKLLAIADSPDARQVWVEGTVAGREFLGEFVRYTVKVGDTDLVADQPHYSGHPGHAPGNRVKVSFDPAQARLLTA